MTAVVKKPRLPPLRPPTAEVGRIGVEGVKAMEFWLCNSLKGSGVTEQQEPGET